MLDSLKKEAQKRKEEKNELKSAIEEEKQRIEEKRKNAKKNIIRKKIKFVDDISTSHEEKRDEKKLAEFKEKETEKVAKARAERRREGVRNNKEKIVIACCIALAVVIGAPVAGYNVHKANIEEQYTSAVDNIVDGDYKAAEDALEEIDMNDSSALLSYAELQDSLDSYDGNAAGFSKALDDIDTVQNSDVADQYSLACAETEKAMEVQESINDLDLEETTLDSKDSLTDISDGIDEIDERYRPLVDTEKLDTALTVVDNIEQQTPAGKTIVSINEIGKVSLNDETKEKIDSAKELYEGLDKESKELVVNSAVLTKAESKYAALEEKHEKEVAEKKAEEARKAAAAKKKKKEEEKARKAAAAEKKAEEEEEQAKLDMTVYLTNSGECFHFDGCPYLKSVRRELTQGEAIREGIPPCSKCSNAWSLPKSR